MSRTAYTTSMSEAQLTTLVRTALRPTLEPLSDSERANRLLSVDLRHVLYCSRQMLLRCIASETDQHLRSGLWGVHDARLADGILSNAEFACELLSPTDETRVGHPLDLDLPERVRTLLDACDPTTSEIDRIDRLLRRLKQMRSFVSPDDPLVLATEEVGVYLRGVRHYRYVKLHYMRFTAPAVGMV